MDHTKAQSHEAKEGTQKKLAPEVGARIRADLSKALDRLQREIDHSELLKRLSRIPIH